MSRPSMISFKGRSASRSTRAALTSRKIPYKVHLDGVDVTPWPLMEDAAVANLALNAAATAVATASTIQNITDYLEPQRQSVELVPVEPSMSFTHMQAATAGAVAGLPSLTAVAKLDDFYHPKSSSIISILSEGSPSRLSKREGEKAEPSEEKERPDDSKPVSLALRETLYFELFDMPSETRVSIDPDYEDESKDRQLFEAQSTAVKTRADVMLQTMDLWVRTKWTQESRQQRRNQQTMVTSWELWDIENMGKTDEDGRAAILRKRQIRKIATEGGIAFQAALKSTSTMSDISGSQEPSSESSDKQSGGTTPSAFSRFSVGLGFTSDKKMALNLGTQFSVAAMIIQRLLVENEARPRQMLYHGIPPKDALHPDLRYIYEPKTLWTFETELSKDRCVTCIAWSEHQLIFAAGYGRYHFTTSNPNGLVKVWNVKNPVFPERTIRLKSPVNVCAFSKRHPNLLAIGLLSGSMVLVDVSTSNCPIIFQSSETGEPLWSIIWLQMESHGEDEMLLAGTQDGRIMRFRRSEQFKSVQMMRVSRSEGSLRGIPRAVSLGSVGVPCSHYTAALTLCECPTETVGYLVGTEDGCIHLCSAHYLHRHLAVSACHVGPVYACQVSPFVDKVYLTCGADWTIRIWAQGIYDPLLTFSSSMEAVESAVWSPLDSCLLASISGNVLSIWDLRRKIPAPAGTATSPTPDKFTVVSWAKDGALLVGDRGGRVHIMTVEGLPLPSFYQQRTLGSSLQKALKVTKPELYAALKKLGKPF